MVNHETHCFAKASQGAARITRKAEIEMPEMRLFSFTGFPPLPFRYFVFFVVKLCCAPSHAHAFV